MKKHILFFGALLFATTLITSCSKDRDLPADNSAFGTIASNRAIIGINQKVLLACEVSVSPLATDAKIQWETSNGLTLEQDSYVDGISYCTFTFDAVGEHTVKCKATYIYGSEVVVAEKSFVAKVYQADFLNSFIGDDLKQVKADNPGIDEDGWFEVSETLHYRFSFKEGEFTRGETFETKINIGAPSPKAAYSFFMLEVKKHEKKATQPIRYVVLMVGFARMANSFTPTPEQEALFKKFKSGELLSDPERAQLGELVESGTIELGALIQVDGINNKEYSIAVKCSMAMTANTYKLYTMLGSRMIA